MLAHTNLACSYFWFLYGLWVSILNPDCKCCIPGYIENLVDPKDCFFFNFLVINFGMERTNVEFSHANHSQEGDFPERYFKAVRMLF